MKAKLHAHYHWIIALVVLVEMAVYGGVVNNINSLYVIPVTEDLGISRSAYSLALSVRALISFGVGLGASVLLLRYGYRKLAVIGLVGMGLGMSIQTGSHSAAMLALGAGTIGVFNNFCATVGATRIVGDWFHSHRGAVLGVITAATGFGGSLFCAFQAAIMERHGWRAAYGTMTALVGIMALVLLLVVRNYPRELGLQPYGEGEKDTPKAHQRGRARDHWQGYDLKALLRKPVFYGALLTRFLTALCIFTAFYDVVPHLQNRGLTPAEAARLQSLLLLLFAGTKILAGTCSDRFGAQGVSLFCVASGAVGIFLLTQVTTPASGLAAIVVFSLCMPLDSILIPLQTTALFGERAHDTAASVFMSMTFLGSMLSAPLANACYDRTGSYQLAFRLAAVLLVVVLVLNLILNALTAGDRKRFELAEKNHRRP